MRMRKANANDKIDDMAKAVKGRTNKVIDNAHEVASAATLKARHGVHRAGEKIKHTGERIEGVGEKIADAGDKIMKLAD